jgi:hypothetical protein
MEQPPATLEAVLVSVGRIHNRMEEASQFERHWRALELMTDTTTGMGYLTVGLAIPTLVAGFDPLTWRNVLTAAVPSSFLVWFGVRLLNAPLATKAHFLDHPDQLPSFLSVFESKQAVKALRAWLNRSDVRDTKLSHHLKRLFFAARLGLASAIGLAASFLALYLTFVFLIFKHAVGTPGAVGLMAALLLAYSGLTWLLVDLMGKKKDAAKLSGAAGLHDGAAVAQVG